MIKSNLPVILLKNLVLLPYQEIRVEIKSELSKKVTEISKLYHDGEVLNEVVLPLMNVSRRTALGEVNDNEPNQQQLYMTSAGVKSSYA